VYPASTPTKRLQRLAPAALRLELARLHDSVEWAQQDQRTIFRTAVGTVAAIAALLPSTQDVAALAALTAELYTARAAVDTAQTVTDGHIQDVNEILQRLLETRCNEARGQHRSEFEPAVRCHRAESANSMAYTASSSNPFDTHCFTQSPAARSTQFDVTPMASMAANWSQHLGGFASQPPPLTPTHNFGAPMSTFSPSFLATPTAMMSTTLPLTPIYSNGLSVKAGSKKDFGFQLLRRLQCVQQASPSRSVPAGDAFVQQIARTLPGYAKHGAGLAQIVDQLRHDGYLLAQQDGTWKVRAT
jgi:hypothetical protein